MQIPDYFFVQVEIIAKELGISNEQALIRLLNIGQFNLSHYPLSECIPSVVKVADNNTKLELSLLGKPDLIHKIKQHILSNMVGYEKSPGYIEPVI